MKVKITTDDIDTIKYKLRVKWVEMGINSTSDFALSILNYISQIITKFSLYAYHYIGEWDTRENCVTFITDIIATEFENVVSPLNYVGDEILSINGLTGNPIPNNFASTFVSEISEDISGTENKEKTHSKTSTLQDNETNTLEKDYDSKIAYQEQNSNTKTNEDSVTSKETNSGSDFAQNDGSTSDTITYGKKVEKEGENWNSNEGSTTGSEQLERVPINAITDNIKTPFSKGNQNGTHFTSVEGGYTDDMTESGTDTKDFIKENKETINYGKIVDRIETFDKYETETGGNNGEKTISDTHLDSETKIKNSSGSDNENENLTGSNDTSRDFRKSDTSKSIDDIIKSHEYLNKIRNYFYSIIFEWLSRFVDEYNTVY